MFARLSLMALESRENPTGPAIVDPISGAAVIAPTVPVVTDATAQPSISDAEAAAQKILNETLRVLVSGW